MSASQQVGHHHHIEMDKSCRLHEYTRELRLHGVASSTPLLCQSRPLALETGAYFVLEAGGRVTATTVFGIARTKDGQLMMTLLQALGGRSLGSWNSPARLPPWFRNGRMNPWDPWNSAFWPCIIDSNALLPV